MRKFLKQYKNPAEDRINYGLMNREFDVSLVEQIVRAMKSTTVIKNIDLMSWSYTDDATKIDMAKHQARQSSNESDDPETFLDLKETRVGELTVNVKITGDGKTEFITKRILIPLIDRNGYFNINGKRSFIIYQLVDSSTYAMGQSLIFKSNMPFTLIKHRTEMKDHNGIIFPASSFNILVYKKIINVGLFYFSKYGVYSTLDYFSLDQFVGFVNEVRDEENNLYFPINKTLFVEVDKKLFIENEYLRDMTCTIVEACTNRLSEEELDDPEYWIKRIGRYNAAKEYLYLEKGKGTISDFERMIDENSKEILKLHDFNKHDAYTILRWMIQNYRELRKKDDTNLKYKRLRSSEYIAALLLEDIGTRLTNLINLGKKASLVNIKDVFKFPSTIILRRMQKSGILRYDERVNDMDMWSKFKYTSKGPNSLGNKNVKNIPIQYRDVHPSQLGFFDINVCGSSDPGLSGIIVPFAQLDGGHFSSEFEPEDGVRDLADIIRKRHEAAVDSDHRFLITELGPEEGGEDFLKVQEKMMALQKTNPITLTFEPVE